jgi:hypothetical protein
VIFFRVAVIGKVDEPNDTSGPLLGAREKAVIIMRWRVLFVSATLDFRGLITTY